MTKQILLALVLASWWTSLLVGQSPPPPPTPTETSEEKQDAGHSEYSNSDLLKQLIAATEENRKAVERQSRENSEQSANDWWIVWFTGALTFVGIVQLIAMFRQAGYMKEGLRLTEQAADAATQSVKVLNRARIVIDKFKFSDEVYAPKADFGFKYALVNKGHTTAHIIQSCDAANVLEILPEVPPDCGDVSGRHVILAPGQELILNFTFTKSESEMKELNEGSQMYAFGVIKYCDEFGSEWETRYGVQCPRESPNAHFVTLPGYNAAT